MCIEKIASIRKIRDTDPQIFLNSSKEWARTSLVFFYIFLACGPIGNHFAFASELDAWNFSINTLSISAICAIGAWITHSLGEYLKSNPHLRQHRT